MASDWPTYMHDASRTSTTNGETIVSPTNAGQLQLLWSHQTGGPIASSATIVSGTAYIGSWDGYEYALDATTGAVKWQTFLGQTTNNLPACYPHVAGVSSAPAVQNGVLYLGGGDNYWYALSATDGHVLWKIYTGDSSAAGGNYNWASPLLYNGYAYVGVTSFCDDPLVQGKLLKVNLQTQGISGTTNIVQNGTSGGGIWTSPTLDAVHNTIILSTGTRTLVSQPYAQAIVTINPTTMAIVDHWQLPIPDQVPDADWGNTPNVFTDGSGHVQVASANKNGYLYAFDAMNLAAGPVWRTRIAVGGSCPQCGGGTAASGAFDGAKLYAAGGTTVITDMNGITTTYGGGIRAIDPTSGSIIWEHGTTGPIIPALAVTNGLVIDEAGKVLEVRRSSDGALLYSYNTGAFIYGGASIANGIIYANSTNGIIYAFAVSGTLKTATPTPTSTSTPTMIGTATPMTTPTVIVQPVGYADTSPITITSGASALNGASGSIGAYTARLALNDTTLPSAGAVYSTVQNWLSTMPDGSSIDPVNYPQGYPADVTVWYQGHQIDADVNQATAHSIVVSFKLQTSMAANSTDKSNYSLDWGNSSPNVLDTLPNVYLWGDNFAGTSLSAAYSLACAGATVNNGSLVLAPMGKSDPCGASTAAGGLNATFDYDVQADVSIGLAQSVWTSDGDRLGLGARSAGSLMYDFLVHSSGFGPQAFLQDQQAWGSTSGNLLPANTWESMRYQVVGVSPGTQLAKVWSASTVEPATWLSNAETNYTGIPMSNTVRLTSLSSSASPDTAISPTYRYFRVKWAVMNSPAVSTGPPIIAPATATATATAQNSATNTSTSTATPANTASNTPTATAMPTSTSVPTSTATNTAVATDTPTSTSVPTSTATNTAVATDTATNTSVPSSTATNTAVATDTPTSTSVPTSTATNTAVATDTPTNTSVPTSTATNTAVATDTATNTSVPTSTPTSTQTDTATATNTALPTASTTPVTASTPTSIPTVLPILLSDGFEKDAIGTAPLGWIVSGGAWLVQQDGSQVVKQSHTGTVGELTSGSSNWSDYTYSADVRSPITTNTSSFGIVGRHQDVNNTYFLVLHGGNSWQFGKRVGGVLTQLGAGPFLYNPGSWYTFQLSFKGNTMTAAIGPRGGSVSQFIALTDPSFLSGAVGFRSSAVVEYDNALIISSNGTSNATATPTAATASTATGTTVSSTNTPISTPSSTSTSGAGTLFADTFSSDIIGGPPVGWTGLGGSWNVQNSSGSNDVAEGQSGTVAELIAGNVAWTNYTYSADVKSPATTVSNSFGIVGRHHDTNNTYFLVLHGGNSWQLGKRVAGVLTQLGAGTFPYGPASWYTMRLSFNGTIVTASIGPRGGALAPLAAVSDTSFAAGAIGFRTSVANEYANVLVLAPGAPISSSHVAVKRPRLSTSLTDSEHIRRSKALLIVHNYAILKVHPPGRERWS